MQTVSTIAEVRARVARWREAAERVALVPTMGNLHDGHIALVRQARSHADRVVVSIFVNPLQFGPNEDFSAYPRTPEQDAERLAEAGADLLFLPQEQEIYPHGRQGTTIVEVPGISEILCGASRPGHFRGVATVVTKLFNIVGPDVALFGEKDFQQLLVIRRLVADLNLPLAIRGVPIVREADGLAMSSRNGYLSSAERASAPGLYRALQEGAARLLAGEQVYREVEEAMAHSIVVAGLQPDYVTIRRREDLAEPAMGERDLVILAAARLGRTRLIDNLAVTVPSPSGIEPPVPSGDN